MIKKAKPLRHSEETCHKCHSEETCHNCHSEETCHNCHSEERSDEESIRQGFDASYILPRFAPQDDVISSLFGLKITRR